jgi:glycine/D-amino acid oxidase-like deaminating enzyme
VTDRDFRVRARYVVFAAGYETQEYLRQKVVELKSTYALVSEPLASFDGWFEQCLLWESARPYLYARTTDDGRVLVGGLDEPFRNPLLRDKLIERKTSKLAESFHELFPAIDLDVAYAWAGTFGETKDGLAYIGQTEEFPHALFALGYGGNGITYSMIAARVITDAVCGLENDDARIFRFDR